jgi:hypothetical protein
MKHEVLKGALRGRGCGVFTHEMPGETRNAVSFHFFPLNFLHTSSSNSNKRSTSTLADSILLLNGTAGSTPFRRPREEDPPITQLHQHQQLQPYSSVNPRSYSPITPIISSTVAERCAIQSARPFQRTGMNRHHTSELSTEIALLAYPGTSVQRLWSNALTCSFRRLSSRDLKLLLSLSLLLWLLLLLLVLVLVLSLAITRSCCFCCCFCCGCCFH